MSEPEVRIDTFVDPLGNHAARLQAPAGKLRIAYDNVAHDSGQVEPRIDGQRLHPIDELPNDVLPYLLSGGTDNKALSTLGIKGYGFAPLKLPAELDFPGMFHGVDERVPLDALVFGRRVLGDLLLRY